MSTLEAVGHLGKWWLLEHQSGHLALLENNTLGTFTNGALLVFPSKAVANHHLQSLGGSLRNQLHPVEHMYCEPPKKDASPH